MIRVLLVDDHELVRAGLHSILDAAHDIFVVGEVQSGEAALEFVHRDAPHVILMDLNMPGMGGIEATRRIRQYDPAVQVIAVTAINENPFPSQLLDAGALGYVTKSCPADEMMEAIRVVHDRRHYVSAEVSRKLTLGKPDTPLAGLSQREIQVMMMITQGKTNQQISDTLFLSPKTISTYRHRLFEKLGVTNDVELTHFALRHGVFGEQIA